MIILLICAAVLILYMWREAGHTPDAIALSAYEKYPYFKDGAFQSSCTLIPPSDNSVSVTACLNGMPLLNFFGHKPPAALPIVPLNRDSFGTPAGHAVYWLGHSSAIVELTGKRFGIDLVFANALPLPFITSRYQEAPLDREDMPPMDYVLISHNHYDHLERKTIRSVQAGLFIVPLGVKNTLTRWGIAPERIKELGWNESFTQDGFTITAVPCRHFSGRTPFDVQKTLCVSYVIETPSNQRIFWSGDSEYGSHFADIGHRFGSFDWAAVEIDSWSDTTLVSEKAAAAIQTLHDLNARCLLPIHWSTFRTRFHPWQAA
ncbi:MAG: MBL fold metallo-hydrolase, partial [Alphaproteobacteria bacterium]